MAGGAPNAGWFAYAPLSEKPFATTPGMDYWALGLLTTGVGTVAAAVNIVATVITLRAPGLTLRRLPLFTWMSMMNSFLILAAIPVLNAALVMLLFDRQFSAHFLQTGEMPEFPAVRLCSGSMSSGRSGTRRCTSWCYPPSG